MDASTLEKVADLYGLICKASVFRASSIRAAEAAKVIENTQRDLNIALMNELAIIFKKIGISTHDVLAAAQTKWNFGRYYPGLVGGHCIPVDPYYLTTLAQRVGYEPKVILAGRAINDAMPQYLAGLLEEGLQEMLPAKSRVPGFKLRILVLGLTFKENVPDTRNSPAKDLIAALLKKGYGVAAYDPHVTREVTERKFGVPAENWPPSEQFDGVIITVAHREFGALNPDEVKGLLVPGGILVDVRGIFAQNRPPGIVYKTL